MCCSVLQSVVVCFSRKSADLRAELEAERGNYEIRVAVCFSVMHCVTVWCSLLISCSYEAQC